MIFLAQEWFEAYIGSVHIIKSVKSSHSDLESELLVPKNHEEKVFIYIAAISEL